MYVRTRNTRTNTNCRVASYGLDGLRDYGSPRNTRRNNRSCWCLYWWVLGCCLVPLDSALSQMSYASGFANSPTGTTPTHRCNVRRGFVATVTGSLFPAYYSINGGTWNALNSAGDAPSQTSTVYPLAPVTWTGNTVEAGGVTGTITPTSYTLRIKVVTLEGDQIITHDVECSGSVAISYSGSVFGTGLLAHPQPVQITVDRTLGAIDLLDELNPPPEVNDDFEDHWGDYVTIPLWVEGDDGYVDIAMGDEPAQRFPVDVVAGEDGGYLNGRVQIPVGWDGTATIGGQDINLAPRILLPSDGSGDGLGLVHSDPPFQIIPGFNPPSIDLPPGMTPGNRIPLPPGVTIELGPQIPMPNHPDGTPARTWPIGITNPEGDKSWRLPPITKGDIVANPVVPPPRGNVVGSGTGTTGNDDDDRAIVDASLGTNIEQIDVPDGLAGVGAKWTTIKGQIEDKFGSFSPLASGSIPTINTISFTLPFGMFGSRNVNLDLQQQPFTTARALSLVIIIFHGAWFFIKFIKV